MLKYLIAFLAIPMVHGAPVTELKSVPAPYTKMDCGEDSIAVNRVFKVLSGDYLNCNRVFDYAETLDEIGEFAPVTPEVNLFVYNSYSSASFDTGNIIRVPLRLTFNGQWGQVYYGNYFGASTVMAHEYGHAIMSKMMEEEEFFKPVKEESLTASNLELKIQEAYINGVEEIEINKLFNELQVVNERRKNNREHNIIFRVSLPYGELFADLVAALHANDKSTMVSALYYDEVSDLGYDMIRARDFEENSLDFLGNFMYEEHSILAPTRQFIGKNLWPKSEEEKTILLNLVYEKILECIKEDLKNPDKRLSPKVINAQLIEKLQ